jgi:branched-chain amino acid transport system substrate-binding protein
LKKGMKVAHLVADYAYGHEMLRGFKRAQAAIGADNVGEILHPFGAADYSTFMPRLMSMRPDVLCISNFGRDQANAIKQAVDFGVKQQMKIVVPVILHNQRLAVGPDVFEGVVGGANYYWGLEAQSKSAAAFNTAFKAANGGAIPTDYGAYGYSGVGSLLAAMQTAGGTDTDKVIDALEKLQYDLTKGPQHYRKCDHQSVQSVLVLESKKKSAMAGDNDLFAILANDTASDDMLRSCSELGHAT